MVIQTHLSEFGDLWQNYSSVEGEGSAHDNDGGASRTRAVKMHSISTYIDQFPNGCGWDLFVICCLCGSRDSEYAKNSEDSSKAPGIMRVG